MSGHNHTPELHEHADAWHHHESAEGLPQAEHLAVLNIRSIAVWGVVSSVALVVIMVALGMYFSSYTTAHKQDKEERLGYLGLSKAAHDARLAAEAALSTGDKKGAEAYAWAPEGGDKVQIPLAKAVDKVIAGYANR